MYKIINPLPFPPSRRPALHLHIFSAYLNYKFCPSLRGHPVPCCQNTLRSDHFQIPVQFPGGNPDRVPGAGRDCCVVGRCGRRAREEVGQVCSDRHQTCTLIEQRLELNNFIVISHRFSRSLVIEIHTYPAPGTTYRRRIL